MDDSSKPIALSSAKRPACRWLQPDGQSTTLRVLVMAAFALVVALSTWRVIRTLHRPVDVPEFQQGLTDFHHIFVFPAIAARQGVNPYDAEFMERLSVNRPYPLYSPAMFWLAYPLAFVPLAVADILYYLGSLLLVVALAASALIVCRLPRTWVNVLGLSTLILLSRPGHVNLLLGQPTLLLVLGAVWALELSQRRPKLAGLALAVTTLKPTFGVPLIWMMLCRRNYRPVVFGTLIGAAAVVAGLAPFVIRDGWRPLLSSLAQSQSYHEADKTVAAESTWTRVDAQALLGKLLPNASGGELVLTAVVLLFAGWIVWRASHGPLNEGADNLSGLVIFTGTLACIYHGTYDVLLLVVPWIGAAAGNLRGQSPPKLRVAIPLLLTVPAANYLSSRSLLTQLSIQGNFWTAVTALNSLAVLTTFLLACYCLHRRCSAASSAATAEYRRSAGGKNVTALSRNTSK